MCAAPASWLGERCHLTVEEGTLEGAQESGGPGRSSVPGAGGCRWEGAAFWLAGLVKNWK